MNNLNDDFVRHISSEFNEELESAPESVNSDPYGAGWMIKVKLSDLSQLDNLMSAGDYKELVG